MNQGIRSATFSDTPFRLGEWLIDPTLNRVFRGEDMVHLELRVMDVLVKLAEHGTGLATRRQLLDEVWGPSAVSENTLTRAIADLRSALGDDARHPRYIETIHRRGYRLLQAPRPVRAGRSSSWSARDRVWVGASNGNGRR